MSLGATVAGRRADYSPSRKPNVPSLEGDGGPVRLDETTERSNEPQDDRRDRHVLAKSGPSSINTCASETDEADYETSSEGPSRLVEGKSSHTRFLSKSHSGNLRKEEATECSKKLPEMEEKPDSRRYAYVREEVEDDVAIESVSLPILRNIESSDTTRVKERMISDSSVARQQKLRMIVEQTEFLLSTESSIGTTTETPEIDRCLSKKYELRRHESLMLLPVIQDIKSTNEGTISVEREKTIKPFDLDQKSSHDQHHHRYLANRDLIGIAENPESSFTSFYLSPYPVNCTRSDRAENSISSSSTITKARRRRISNDTDVLLKIHGEFSPLRNELSEIAAKFRALKLQRMADPFEDSKKNSSILSGKNINDSGYALLRRTYIDRGVGSGGFHARCCLVGNSQTQFSPITMVGKSNSRESCSRPSSIGTTRLLATTTTGFHPNHNRSYREPNDSSYFRIASGQNTPVEYLGERIANSRPSSSFGRYRPRSSCMHDRYYQNQQKGIVRSFDERSYYTNRSSGYPYDTSGNRYISRPNAEEPPDILILSSSKETIREEDHRTSSRGDRQRSKEDLRNTSMANVLDENSLLSDKGTSTVSPCKERRRSVRSSEERKSISPIENIEISDGKTTRNSASSRESKLVLKHQRTTIVDRSSQTSTRVNEFKEKSNVSSISEKRMRVISVPKSLEKVKIVPVLFTAGIPEPLLPFFRMDDVACSGNPEKRSGQRMITLKRRNSRMISSSSSGKRGPSESETSGSYVTGPLTLPRDYFSENERWRRDTSKISMSCVSRSGSSKRTSSSKALKYSSALGSVCSAVARVTVSGSTVADQQRKRQIRATSTEKGIRGMRSSPEDFLCDT